MVALFCWVRGVVSNEWVVTGTEFGSMTEKGHRYKLVVGGGKCDDEILIKFLCPCFSISEGGGLRKGTLRIPVER